MSLFTNRERLASRLRASAAAGVVFAALLAVAEAQAANATITKANNNDALNLTTSWVGGAVPGDTDLALFNNTFGGTGPSLNLGANTTWGAIQLTNPTRAVTITSTGTLTLNANSPLGSGTGMSISGTNLTIIRPLILGASQTWTVGAGRTLSTSLVSSNGSVNLTLDNSGRINWSGPSTGLSGTVTLNSGTLQLAQNSMSAAFILNSGTAQRFTAGSGFAGSPAVTLNGGEFQGFNGAGATEIIGSLSGTGGNWVFNGGELRVGNSQSTTFAGRIIGDFGALTKVGSGTLTLTNSSTIPISHLMEGSINLGSTGKIIGNANGNHDIRIGANLIGSGSSEFFLGSGGGLTVTETNPGTTGLTTTISTILSGGESATVAINAGSGNTVVLSGNNSYTDGTYVQSGVLVVNGDNSSSYATFIQPAGVLQGSGKVNRIQADPDRGDGGLVSPGNSPGILTATQTDPTGGGALAFAFEMTGAGSPAWSSGTASTNDVLRLTDSTTPFMNSLSATNTVSVYFNVGSLSGGEVFRGGFFTDTNSNFTSDVDSATYVYYAYDPSGTTSFQGVNYSPLATMYPSLAGVTRSVVQVASANFADGTVSNGWVQQFAIVPEPGSVALVASGVGGLLAFGRFRRRRR